MKIRGKVFMDVSSEAQQSGYGRLVSAIVFRPILGKALLIFLAVLPALLLLADIRAFAVNVPFMDDWQFVPLLEKARNGTLTFQELFAPHDEHRLLLPRIIIIASMFATGGDYRAQSYITFAVVAVASGCLLWLLIRLNGKGNSVLWAWVLANIALFSPIQFHNWLWPMQFAYFLPYTFLALCLCTLYARIPALPKFVMAAGFALAGNYSFVQGNLIWPAALPVILFAPEILRKDVRRNFAIAWIALGALALTLYFWGLEHNSAASDYAYGYDGVPPTMSTLHQFQERPGYTVARMGHFILGIFGNSIARGFPVADNLAFSRVCGAIVLILAVIGLAAAWWRGLFLNRALPWACLLLFTFLTAAFVCVGRVWRGDGQPLTPRYATFGTFCIVSLVALLSSGFSGLPEDPSLLRSGSASRWSKAIFWTQGLLAGLYLAVHGVSWTYGQQLMEEWNTTRWRALARLHFLGKIHTEAKADVLGGSDVLVLEMAKLLERMGMMKQRAEDLRVSALGKEGDPKGLKRGQFEALTMHGPMEWRASGSAPRCADAVILSIQNAVGEWVAIAAATPLSLPQYLAKSTRMDLEFLAVSGPQKQGEWEINLPLGAFGELRSGILRAWAMDFRQHVLYQLPGDQEFTVISKPDRPSQELAAREKDPSEP
jgi:hypothetical protein